MPTVFAAAAPPSTLAPVSDGKRRLMIEAKPILFSSGTASGVVAPPQATVVSSLAKFIAPGTVGLVTCCADAWPAPNAAATTRTRAILISMCGAPSMKGHHSSGRRRFRHDGAEHRDDASVATASSIVSSAE